MTKEVVLAYSGGLDTSAAIPWLGEKGWKVIALTVDVGQGEDLDAARERALSLGASKALVVDAVHEFAEEYIGRAVMANALYEGVYPLGTALARPLIARKLVDVAHELGAEAVAHGCTGKGNDQVRFEVSIAALGPDLRVLAPARVWGMSREQEAHLLQALGHDLPAAKGELFSVDANLWSRSVEGGDLEDTLAPPPPGAFSWTRDPWDDDGPEEVSLTFEGGLPVALNGDRRSPADLIGTLNVIAGGHGIGRIDHVEGRVVGIKSRELYEAPAATVILAAHKVLEAMVLPSDLLHLKASLEPTYASLIYSGQWFSPTRQALEAFMASSQGRVTGTVTLKLFGGGHQVVSRWSPFSLYRPHLATYGLGDAFDARAAEGFLYIQSLASRTWAEAALQERHLQEVS